MIIRNVYSLIKLALGDFKYTHQFNVHTSTVVYITNESIPISPESILSPAWEKLTKLLLAGGEVKNQSSHLVTKIYKLRIKTP